MTQVVESNPSSVPGCPIDHSQYFHRKTGRTGTIASKPSLEEDASGIWHIYSFDLARLFLRSSATQQDGFNAESILQNQSVIMNPPVLYLEGEPHHRLRRETARFFAPKTTDEHYRPIMERTAQKLINKLIRKRKIQLDDLSMTLATKVAAEVVGLTNSIAPGMEMRLNTFFNEDNNNVKKLTPFTLHRIVYGYANIFSFFFLDVLPAIKRRRKKPQSDVISHLLSRDYNNIEIMTEAVMYGAAGMATTREFICIAAWHMLEQPELRKRYMAASLEDRYTILHEILRLEPVVGTLHRTVVEEIQLPHPDGHMVTLPVGAKVAVHIDAVNLDQAVTGDLPAMLCPERELQGERVNQPLMSFGDGHHRCAGAYIAIQESDIFLHKLLSLPNLRIAQKPTIHWSEITQGYEIRDFMLELV